MTQRAAIIPAALIDSNNVLQKSAVVTISVPVYPDLTSAALAPSAITTDVNGMFQQANKKPYFVAAAGEVLAQIGSGPQGTLIAVIESLAAGDVNAIAAGTGPVMPWAATTFYPKGMQVTQGGYFWASAADHTSGSTFSGAAPSGNWVQESPVLASPPVTDAGPYQQSGNYASGAVIPAPANDTSTPPRFYFNDPISPIAPITAEAFTPAHWQKQPSGLLTVSTGVKKAGNSQAYPQGTVSSQPDRRPKGYGWKTGRTFYTDFSSPTADATWLNTTGFTYTNDSANNGGKPVITPTTPGSSVVTLSTLPGVTMRNMDVVVVLKHAAASGFGFGNIACSLFARWAGANDNIALTPNFQSAVAGLIGVFATRAGSNVGTGAGNVIGTDPNSQDTTSYRKMRLRVTEDVIAVKVWKVGTLEPFEWLYEYEVKGNGSGSRDIPPQGGAALTLQYAASTISHFTSPSWCEPMTTC